MKHYEPTISVSRFDYEQPTRKSLATSSSPIAADGGFGPMVYGDGDEDDEDDEDDGDGDGDDEDDVAVQKKHSYERRTPTDVPAVTPDGDEPEDEVGDDFDDFEEGAEADDFGDFDDGFQKSEETFQSAPPPKQLVMPTPPPFVSRAVIRASMHCIALFNHQNNLD